MIPTKNVPLLLNLAYYGFNRGLKGGDFEPIIDAQGNVVKTFCNYFIQYVCNGFGYTEFQYKMANEIIDFISEPKNGWIKVDDGVAQAHANNGVLVIAGHKMTPHGHVCLIIPGVLEKSYSYQKSVPKCVNIGKDVFIGKKVSFAFKADEMPDYYALTGMI